MEVGEKTCKSRFVIDRGIKALSLLRVYLITYGCRAPLLHAKILAKPAYLLN